MSTWTSWRLHRYTLPLTRPLTTGADALHRHGLILELEGDHGHIGLGEAAPLPGLHRTTLPAVSDALIAALSSPDPAASSLPPVAQLAIEGAALMLSAAHLQREPVRLLCTDPVSAVAVNALITGPDPVASAQEAIAGGHVALKLKVGRSTLAQDLRVLAGIRALSQSVEIRLDANRAWQFDDAAMFCDAAMAHGIAYIEEPLADPDQLTRLHRQTGIPLALDESLLEDRGAVTGVAAIIIKPSLLGLSGSLRWIAQAKSMGAAAVISGAFESGIARRVNLALAAVAGTTVSGLSTAGWLAEDLLDPPLQPTRGRYTLPIRGHTLVRDRLTEIAAG